MRYYYHLNFVVTIGLIEKDKITTFYETNVEYDANGENVALREALAQSLNKYRRREDIKHEHISLVHVQLLKDIGPVAGVFKNIEITDLVRSPLNS